MSPSLDSGLLKSGLMAEEAAQPVDLLIMCDAEDSTVPAALSAEQQRLAMAQAELEKYAEESGVAVEASIREAEGIYRQADALFKRGDFVESYEVVKRAIQVFPGHTVALAICDNV